ncbi:hypothetical protein GIB67_027680 [Kingdonia uniflora]|uniref:ABC1 atypical kinase-like domain-containing protein n=1 Tax=Kingdonia uniflora TaxID=39325 RepID=A0A7J7NLQ3_9MAGN|nr:hypothetical protein GIB67_027680 [Kingdonia uniflora]
MAIIVSTTLPLSITCTSPRSSNTREKKQRVRTSSSKFGHFGEVIRKDLDFIKKGFSWANQIPKISKKFHDLFWLRNLEDPSGEFGPPVSWPQPQYTGLTGVDLLMADLKALEAYASYFKHLVKTWSKPLPEVYNPQEVDNYFNCRPHVVALRFLEVFTSFTVVAIKIRTAGISKFTGLNGDNSEYYFGQLLKETMLNLGPTFIKVGQSLSTRPDIIGSEMSKALSELHDRIPPFPRTMAMQIIKEEFGCPVEMIFSYISEEPVAAASFGQVYRASTLDGSNVAVKVQRPNLHPVVVRDIYILRLGLRLLQKVAKRKSDLRLYADELGKGLVGELDYTLEAANALEFREAHSSFTFIYVPRIFKHLSRKRVLTMEWVVGENPNDLLMASTKNEVDHASTYSEKEQFEAKKRLLDLVSKGVEASLIQLLETGLLHADPHPGNLRYTAAGQIGDTFLAAAGIVLTPSLAVADMGSSMVAFGDTFLAAAGVVLTPSLAVADMGSSMVVFEDTSLTAAGVGSLTVVLGVASLAAVDEGDAGKSERFLDFGLICRMKKKHQLAMLSSIVHIVNGDWAALFQDLTQMDVVKPGTSIRLVIMDLEDSLGEVEFKDGIPDIKFSKTPLKAPSNILLSLQIRRPRPPKVFDLEDSWDVSGLIETSYLRVKSLKLRLWKAVFDESRSTAWREIHPTTWGQKAKIIDFSASFVSVCDWLKVPYHLKPLGKLTDIVRVLGKIWSIALKYHFRMPPYYTLVLRSLASLEGLAGAADENFKTFESAYPYVVRKLLTDNSAASRRILHSVVLNKRKEYQWQKLALFLRVGATRKSLNKAIASNSVTFLECAPTGRGGVVDVANLVLRLLPSKDGIVLRRLLMTANGASLTRALVSNEALLFRQQAVRALADVIYQWMNKVLGPWNKEGGQSSILPTPIYEYQTLLRDRRLKVIFYRVLESTRKEPLLMFRLCWVSFAMFVSASALACHQVVVSWSEAYTNPLSLAWRGFAVSV